MPHDSQVKLSPRPGSSDNASLAYQDYEKVFNILTTDLVANVYRVPVEGGQWIKGVCARVATVFAGGTPTVKIGDAADDDGFLQTVDLSTTTLDAVCDSRQLGRDIAGTHTLNGYAKGGRFYAVADQLICTFATGATSGKLELHVILGGYNGPTVRKGMVK